VFLWRTHYEPNNLTVRKDRNNYYEAIKAHNAVVTCSVFAPNPQLVFDQLEQNNPAADINMSDSLNLNNLDSKANETTASATSKFNSNASFKRDTKPKDKSNPGPGYVVISGDYDGEINVFYNAIKPKHSSLPT